MPTIAQMRLVSASSAKSSFRQSKPSSSRKVKRPESPGLVGKNVIASMHPKQREKISVYPTQRAQPMKPATNDPVEAGLSGKRAQGSIYASSEIYLNTERPGTQKHLT